MMSRNQRRLAADYLARPLAHREQSHRRAILFGVGALILLSTSPVFGHHLASRAEAMLIGRDHLLNVCLVALHELLSPVHELSHVVLVAGVAYALGARLRALYHLRRTLGALSTVDARENDGIAGAASSVGIPLGTLRIIAGLPTPAFTAGWLRPRIYVASELATKLSADELAAVIAHEAAHVRRLDPLRLSLLRFFSQTLFYIPALTRLAEDIADEAEIAADDLAVASRAVRPTALASAIIALADWGVTGPPRTRHALGAAVGFQQPNLLERRVRRLIGQDVPVGSHVTRRSVGGAVAALTVVWLSGLMMAHPLPADASTLTGAVGALGGTEHHESSHCQHRGHWAFTHIFCLGVSHHTAGAVHCPHAGQ